MEARVPGALRRARAEPRGRVAPARRRPLLAVLDNGDEEEEEERAATDARQAPQRTLESTTAEADDALRLTLDDMGGRRRRISGSLPVAAPREALWRVLTAYEEMVDFVPGMISSEYDAERQLLEQVAFISRKLQLRSRILMHVEEWRDAGEIWFSMRESRDFRYWRGVYRLRRVAEDAGSTTAAAATATMLEYELDAVPSLLFPVSMVEGKILKEVPRVLRAIRDRAESFSSPAHGT